MNLFAHFHDVVVRKLDELSDAGNLPAGVDLGRVAVEPPRDPSHGDISTNAAMVLAKPAGLVARQLAEQLADALAQEPDIETVDVAGPGFINIRLRESFWGRILEAILNDDAGYGSCAPGSRGRVNVEYVSANPTGPLHVGHCRGAIFGDALASLLEKTGFDVTREYYINDAGVQVEVLARSAYLRYLEALGEDIGDIPSGLYPGSYLKPVGENLAATHGDVLKGKPEEVWLDIVRDTTVEMMMDVIRDDLAALSIKHDVFFSERSLAAKENNVIQSTIDGLRSRGLVFEGHLPPPKGQVPEDWEDREQTLFKATEFGDDIDRPLVKSDGNYTYFASDIAYHANKYSRGFKEMIDVWGADHSGYIKRMQSAVKAVTGGEGTLDVKICQLVRLYRGGEPIKMSKRSGDFVTLRDVVDEVGPGAVRFMMLYRKNDAPLDFDFKKVTEQSRDNPVFYVQYAHARIHSVFRNASELLSTDTTTGALPEAASLSGASFMRLTDGAELAVAKRLAEYPRMLQSAAAAHEPHRIAFYLYELASEFHGLWNKGKESPQLRFIVPDDKDVTMARLGLLRAVAAVLAGGLGILGVQAIEEMR